MTVDGRDEILDLMGVTAALAVLAGIAASDAACCAKLGQHSRGQDHRQATALLSTVRPHGEQMAKDLLELLKAKDNAHYGTIEISQKDAVKLVERAKRMTDSARQLVQG